MARTAITITTPPASYPALPLAANSADVTLAAADVANGNQIAWGQSGRMVVLVQNSGASSAHTVTITSAPDAYNRTGDITSYSLAAGELGAFVLNRAGWMQADGNLYLAGDHAEIKIGAFRI